MTNPENKIQKKSVTQKRQDYNLLSNYRIQEKQILYNLNKMCRWKRCETQQSKAKQCKTKKKKKKKKKKKRQLQKNQLNYVKICTEYV